MRQKSATRRLVPLLFLVTLIGVPEPAAAQFRSAASMTPLPLNPDPAPFEYLRQAPTRRSGVAAFAIETLGGAAGSAAGFGIGVLLADPDACNNEDIQCILQDVAVALGASAAGAALGTWGAGTLASTRPSLPGAAVGSLAGAIAGIGTIHLLTEELDLGLGDGVQLASYLVVHGVVTALGSRLIAALRN